VSDFFVVCGPRSFHEKTGCPEIVLWDVFLDVGVVFLDR